MDDLPVKPSEQNRSSDPSQEDFAKHYTMFNRGLDDDGAYRNTARYYIHELKPLLPKDHDISIIDIGSGNGYLVRYLLDSGYSHVGAVDLSPVLLNAIQKALGDRMEFTCVADGVEFLKDNPNRFDVITLFDMIEHIEFERHFETVQAIYHALRERGRVIIRTGNMANMFVGAYTRYMDYTHHYGFTEFSLCQLLRNGGFRSPQLFIPQLYGTVKQRLKRRFMRWFQRKMIQWQDRVVPHCFDKNIIVWAEKESK